MAKLNPMTTHQIPIRIYYEDTDAGGIVYHANYLRFAERGRTEWLRDRGFSNSALRTDCGILIVVKTMEIDYKRPAVLDDSLILETAVIETGNTSLRLVQRLYRDDAEICVMNVTLVCVAVQSGKPVRWPTQVLETLNPQQGN